jgi:hypothetical protein
MQGDATQAMWFIAEERHRGRCLHAAAPKCKRCSRTGPKATNLRLNYPEGLNSVPGILSF